jgi:hypothetical protein
MAVKSRLQSVRNLCAVAWAWLKRLAKVDLAPVTAFVAQVVALAGVRVSAADVAAINAALDMLSGTTAAATAAP